MKVEFDGRHLPRRNAAPRESGQEYPLAHTRLKPLVARAGAVINGYGIEQSDDMTTGEQQATVDALLDNP